MKLESGGIYRDEDGDYFIYVENDNRDAQIYFSCWGSAEHRWHVDDDRYFGFKADHSEYIGSITEMLNKIAENN